jgi:hypothetical protein
MFSLKSDFVGFEGFRIIFEKKNIFLTTIYRILNLSDILEPYQEPVLGKSEFFIFFGTPVTKKKKKNKY